MNKLISFTSMALVGFVAVRAANAAPPIGTSVDGVTDSPAFEAKAGASTRYGKVPTRGGRQGGGCGC